MSRNKLPVFIIISTDMASDARSSTRTAAAVKSTRLANDTWPNKAPPKHWPSNVYWLIRPFYSKIIASSAYDSFREVDENGPRHLEKTPPGRCTLVNIACITNPSHPACGQYGLFAAQNLLPDTYIISYIGFVHTAQESDPDSDYDLSLDRDLGISIDATKMGNEARMINDYRGVRDQGPNAEFRDVWYQAPGLIEKRTAVYVLSAGKSGKRAKGITKGEEILVSYGKGFWNERRMTENCGERGAG